MWARFDDEYDENPKCRAAGKDGRALDSAGIRYSAKHLTDGLIPDHDLPLLAAKADVGLKRTLRRLLDVGRWHGPGHDCDRCPECPPGWHVIHDYLDFNPSADVEREKRRKRAEAGRKGGQRSRSPGTKPEANASANAQANTEAEAEAPPEPSAQANQNPVPVPVPPDVNKSSSNLRGSPPSSDDEDPQQPSPPAPTDPDTHARTETALAILARSDLDKRQQADHLRPLVDPSSWETEALARRRERHAAELATKAREHPELSPELLAASIDAAPKPADNDPLAGQRQAMRNRAETGTNQVRDVLAQPPPDDTELERIRQGPLAEARRRATQPGAGQ